MKKIESKDIIYPNINIVEGKYLNTYFIKILTNVRKLHTDKKWYLSKISFTRKKEIITDDDNVIFLFRQESINYFLLNVYNFQLFGVVNTNLKLDNEYDNEAFILDENQDNEEERIKKLF
jgi:hypothetical protein